MEEIIPQKQPQNSQKINYFQYISINIFREILGFLKIDQLFQLRIVNKQCNLIIEQDTIWKIIEKKQNLKLYLLPEENNYFKFYQQWYYNMFKLYYDDEYQDDNDSDYMDSESCMEMGQCVQSKSYAEAIQNYKFKYLDKIQLKGLQASTQDYDQNIHQTLNENSYRFWSSEGTVDKYDRDEFLLFQILPCQNIVRDVFVKFFYAYYLDNKLYLSEKIKISLGMTEDNFSYEQVFELPSEDDILNSAENDETYVSKSEKINDRISFQLTITKPILARFIKLTFIGKTGIQETDNQYYNAVDSIRVVGFSQLKKQESEISQLLNKCHINYLKNHKNQEALDLLMMENYEEYIQNLYNQQVQNEEQMIQFFIRNISARQNQHLLLDIVKWSQQLKKLYFQQVCKQDNQLTDIETYIFLQDKVNPQKYECLKNINNFDTAYDENLSYLQVAGNRHISKHLLIKFKEAGENNIQLFDEINPPCKNFIMSEKLLSLLFQQILDYLGIQKCEIKIKDSILLVWDRFLHGPRSSVLQLPINSIGENITLLIQSMILFYYSVQKEENKNLNTKQNTQENQNSEDDIQIIEQEQYDSDNEHLEHEEDFDEDDDDEFEG